MSPGIIHPWDLQECASSFPRVSVPGRRRAKPGDEVSRTPREISCPGKCSPEEKIHIVPERFRREVTVNDLCRAVQASLLLLMDQGLRDAIAADGSPLSLTMMLHANVARGRQSRGE